MKSHFKVLICALVLSAALAVVSNITTLILNFGRQPFPSGFAVYGAIFTAAGIASYVINPLVVFVVFYFIGREIILTKMMKSTLISLAVGCLVGYLVVYVPIILLTEVLLPNSPAPFWAILLIMFFALYSGALRVFSSIFFVALAAIAMAYIRKPKVPFELSSPPAEVPPGNGLAVSTEQQNPS